MSLPDGWAQDAAHDLVRHLSAHTTAGIPHIGLLGPGFPTAAKAPDEPVEIEEDEFTSPKESETDSDFAEWRFVPNRLAYQLTVRPVGSNPSVTLVTFYVRIREGCDGDVAGKLDDRPEEYRLSTSDLRSAFRKYGVEIASHLDGKPPGVAIFREDTQITPRENQVRFDGDAVSQRASVEIQDESDPFLVFEEGKPKVVKQIYGVRISKAVRKVGDRFQINVEVRNISPKTPPSVLPERRAIEDTHEVEDEGSALKRYADDMGLVSSPLWSAYKPRLFKVQFRTNNPFGNRYGYLMELTGNETVSSSVYPCSEADLSRTVNCIVNDEGLESEGGNFHGALVYKDYNIFQEEVPLMTPGSSPDVLFSALGLDNRLRAVISDDLGFKNFHLFQDLAIQKIVETIRSSEPKNTVVISARTAGGKTEAFLIPILDDCVKGPSVPGVKAIVFYPTKALANDQTSRYIEILYHLNKRLGDRKITLGLLHGDISKRGPEAGEEAEWDLPLACPKCADGALRVAGDDLRCDSCNEVMDFVTVANRQTIYARPPDILITNPDTLVWVMMVMPQRHSIFGRPVFVCNSCKSTYAPKSSKRKCDNPNCNSADLSQIHPCVPRFVVFDEVHLFKGTFGINCSYFLSRLESTLDYYRSTYHSSSPRKLVRIGSTATISNPESFGRLFFNSPKVEVVPKDEDERARLYQPIETAKGNRRVHVYVMPYAYNSDSTVGRSIQYLQKRSKLGTAPTTLEESRAPWNRFLQTLTFVNSVRASNNLISLTRRTCAEDFGAELQINGHTTDFDKAQRASIERGFNRFSLNVIFSTPTLEVGVDFRRVDIVVVDGFPFSFNDYIQRIGRGGRGYDSLVLTVCQNWSPVDHYYYSNGQRALQNPLANVEPVPITRDNLEALKKHSRGAVFDWLARMPGSATTFEDFRELKRIKESVNEIAEACESSVGNVSAEEKSTADSSTREFVDWLTNLAFNENAPSSLFGKFYDQINERYQLTALRSTDREITVEVRWAE
nr:DEAD/DEAH box helicase [Ferrimicrobium acidiphilum]